MADLRERDVAILNIEARHWRHAGTKEQAIREQLNLSATRYYQLLDALLDEPAALERNPVLVNRLRRVREQRRAARSIRARDRSTSRS